MDAARPDLDAKRAAYLSQFVPRDAGHTTLYAHPDVQVWEAHPLAEKLDRTHNLVTSRLELAAKAPLVYLYPSVGALREHSCASPLAVAYYDGAIHLAMLSVYETRRSLEHEYVHHVLMSNGIGKPIWFQEGAAMHVANDMPRDYLTLWRENPVDPEKMVDAFPTTDQLDEATIYYAQAYAMTEFLQRLCSARIGCGLGELANALASGRVEPESLFEWATAVRGRDLNHTTRVTLWDDYVAHGHFPPETLDALSARERGSPVEAARSTLAR